MGHVYLVKKWDLYKIGHTDNLENRLKQLKSPQVIQTLSTDRSLNLERELHKKYRSKRLPQSEWFRLNPKEVDEVRRALGWIEPPTSKPEPKPEPKKELKPIPESEPKPEYETGLESELEKPLLSQFFYVLGWFIFNFFKCPLLSLVKLIKQLFLGVLLIIGVFLKDLIFD